MKAPKLDQPTFWLVYACGGYIAVQIFAAGVEWERDRAHKAARKSLHEATVAAPLSTPAADAWREHQASATNQDTAEAVRE